jgi:hypothetical protein
MSHFSVLVISETQLTEEAMRPILQPWHEYECTGVDDEYVIDVDITDKVTASFNEEQEVVVLADGTVIDRYSDSLYQYMGQKDSLGMEKKEFVLPEGAIEKTMTGDEARGHGIGYKTMKICAKVEYGGFECRGRFYRKTNPNAKWDWWTVGGRWTGMLIPNYDPEKDPANKETCSLCNGTGTRTDMVCQNGCNGCGGTGIKVKWPTQWAKVGDILQVKDIPFTTLRDLSEAKAVKWWDDCHAIIAGRYILSWDNVRETCVDIKDAREIFQNDPVKKDLEAAKLIGFWDATNELENLRLSRAAYVTRSRNNAVSTFAVVKGGVWYERGSMGWWGCVSDEKDVDSWGREYAALIDGLSPDTWVAVVDCHI